MREQLRCELVSLDRVYQLCLSLAGEITRDGFAPEAVIAVARGGFVPARLLCDFLGLRALGSMTIRHYEAGAQRRECVEVVARPTLDVRGRRTLLVDDVNDSGNTLRAAHQLLVAAGAREVRSAVLHEKAGSCAAADFTAEFVGTWRWILYQWAVVEDLGAFLARREPRPASDAEALAWLREEHGLTLEVALWEQIAPLLMPRVAR